MFNDQDAIEFIELNFFNLSISGKEHQFEILRFIIGQKKSCMKEWEVFFGTDDSFKCSQFSMLEKTLFDISPIEVSNEHSLSFTILLPIWSSAICQLALFNSNLRYSVYIAWNEIIHNGRIKHIVAFYSIAKRRGFAIYFLLHVKIWTRVTKTLICTYIFIIASS